MNSYKFKQNKYLKYYQSLIDSRSILLRNKKDGNIYEKHHILPKSLGGSNLSLNLILLSPREHFIAHLMLVRIVQDSDVYKMISAIRRFKKKLTTAKEYELLKITMSKYSTGKFNASYGKMWIYEVGTLKISYVSKEEFDGMDKNKYFKGLPYQRGGHRGTIWVNNKINESCIKPDQVNDYINKGWGIGRCTVKTTEEMKYMSSFRHTAEKDKEHSIKMSGQNHFNYGKDSFNKGKMWINNQVISKLINPSNLSNMQSQGWARGRLKS